MDLALSVTHFPESSLTFAIVYGCTVSIEKEIIKRLYLIKEEATHPALMPGIFAELERSRHMRLVQSKIAVLEMTILEVDHQSDDIDTTHRARVDKRNVKKRTTWLDATYLRNGLLSWSTQLERMIESLTDLEMEPSFRRGPIFSRGYDTEVGEFEHARHQGMKIVGSKIKARLNIIRNEYQDWIRDCTMRVDGMAMATQWVWKPLALALESLLTDVCSLIIGSRRDKRRDCSGYEERLEVHAVYCSFNHDFPPGHISSRKYSPGYYTFQKTNCQDFRESLA